MIYATIFGYYVLKDTYFLPSYLGGSGDHYLIFSQQPYPKHPPLLKEYMISVTSYQLGQMVMHIFKRHGNDYSEMGFHHIVTMYLIVGSYLMNSMEGGAVIAFLHDASDIPVMFAKGFSQTKFKNCTIFWFVSMLLCWGYFRNSLTFKPLLFPAPN